MQQDFFDMELSPTIGSETYGLFEDRWHFGKLDHDPCIWKQFCFRAYRTMVSRSAARVIAV
jgi:hypothetical protein